jgi:hypothetical protein
MADGWLVAQLELSSFDFDEPGHRLDKPFVIVQCEQISLPRSRDQQRIPVLLHHRLDPVTILQSIRPHFVSPQAYPFDTPVHLIICAKKRVHSIHHVVRKYSRMWINAEEEMTELGFYRLFNSR